MNVPVPALPARVAVSFAAALLGAGVAAATVGLHGYGWGLALGLAAHAATLIALPGGWWARLPYALAWSVAVVVLGVERAEGDYLVASDVAGYLLLLAVPVTVVAGVVGLRRSVRSARALDSR